MAADAKSVLKLIKDKEVKFVDLRFTDPRGKWQHVTFDDVRYDTAMNKAFYHIESTEGPYNSGTEYEAGNSGHRPPVKGGYFPVPPVDAFQDIRSEMLAVMGDMGIEPEKHHHEVAPSQHELGFKFQTLTNCGDR